MGRRFTGWLLKELVSAAFGYGLGRLLSWVGAAGWLGALGRVLSQPNAPLWFIGAGVCAGLIWSAWPELSKNVPQFSRREQVVITIAIVAVLVVVGFVANALLSARQIVYVYPVTSRPPAPKVDKKPNSTPTPRTIVRIERVPVVVYETPAVVPTLPQRTTIRPRTLTPPTPNGQTNVLSKEQSGGVNAGSITNSTINQQTSGGTRSKYLGSLQEFYASGVSIENNLKNDLQITDSEIYAEGQQAQTWANNTGTWIKANMGDAAFAHFNDTSGKLSLSYQLQGSHDQKAIQTRSNVLNNMGFLLQNLEDLMNSTTYEKP